MRLQLQRKHLASASLYLALLAGIAAFTLYIIQREWNLYLQISLGLVVVGLAVYAVLNPQQVRQFLVGRQARYGSNALIMTIAFVGILVVANYVGYENSKRWDLTEDKQNTLAAETLDTLKKLPQSVEALAFYTQRTPSDSARSLLDQYKFEGKGKFEYRFIDPEADPIAAQNAKITRDGTIVLKMGERQELVEFATEKDITSALVRLISGETRAVYFLTGHGEHGLEAGAGDGYSTAKSVLESKNYKVETLNLLSTHKLPEDADVIVIAGPRQPLSTDEVELLKGFLENGGSLVVLEDPTPTTDFGDQPDPLADYLNQSWGIALGNDIVVDLTSQQPFVAVANQYASHPITEKLRGLVTFFPTVRSVQIKGDFPGVVATELVLTADQAWAETDLAGLQDQQNLKLSPDEGKDLIGRVPLAVSAEVTGKTQRVVVIGDSDFASDANFSRYGNGDLLVNSIDWAVGQENLINLTPKDTIQRVLVPPQRYTLGMILFGSVFLLPGVVLLSGIIVWIQRRKRG